MKTVAAPSSKFDIHLNDSSDGGQAPPTWHPSPTISQRVKGVSPMIRMTLSFVTREDSLTLHRTSFRHPLLQEEIVAIRGAAAPHSFGNFRWSSGVRALALLLVRQALVFHQRQNGGEALSEPAAIEGHDHSLAASLDYAISKQPLWLQDMFGVSPQGAQLARLLFRRINPDRKRPGPVIVFISNKEFEVRVEVDGRAIGDATELRRLQERLESQGCQGS